MDIDKHQDRLSELPKSLILEILSFLPMRDVVSTTFLSKQWQNLWTTVPCLHFHNPKTDEKDASEKFQKFVNGALKCWKGAKIVKFEIDMRSYFDRSLTDDMNLWVHFAVKHKVEELSISLVYDHMDWGDAVMCSNRYVYTAPMCLKTCASIKKLSVVGCGLRMRESPTWGELECLRMEGYCFSEHLINQILSGSPRMEVFDLRLLESNENLNIRSTSLKKVKIEKYVFREPDEPSRDTMLRICCPNLETLEILGCVYAKCLFTDVSSLTDATLWFEDLNPRELHEETLRQILATFQHVENLALSVYSSEVLGESLRKKMLSPLPNVKFLELSDDSFEDIAYDDVINVLAIFPNVKMLVILDCAYKFVVDPPQIETNLPEPHLTRLKTIQIISPLYNSSMGRVIEFLLRHASMLETLAILHEPNRIKPDQTFLHKFAKKLSSLPRSSPTAKVIIRQGFRNCRLSCLMEEM